MKVILIWGPQAVGKMAVGYEIAKIKGYKVLHAHMTIEMLIKLFDWGSPQFNKLDIEFYFRLLEELAKSDIPGLILTKVRLLNRESDNKLVEKILNFFITKNHPVYEVELFATLEERLRRNKTPLRLKEKVSKQDIAFSEDLINQWHNSDLETTSSEPFGRVRDNHLKIDTSNLTEIETAKKIIDAFNL